MGPPSNRVVKSSSPVWEKLNMPAIGHVTGTGSLAVRFSYWARYGDRVFGCEVQLLGML